MKSSNLTKEISYIPDLNDYPCLEIATIYMKTGEEKYLKLYRKFANSFSDIK